jgi:hypothetical protein
MKLKSYITGVAMLGILATAACKEDFEYSNEFGGKAFIGIHHAAPATATSGSTSVDLYLNNTLAQDSARPFVYNTTFGGGGIPYITTAPGTVNVRINANKTATVLVPTTPLTVDAGKYYSVFAYDTILQPNKTIKALALTDDLTPPTNPANTKIRFLHFVPNVPPATTGGIPQAVDVWAFRSAMDSVKLYNAIPFIGQPGTTPNAAALSTFIEVPSMAYIAIRIRLAGTNTNAISILPTTPATLVPLAPGKIYTILARGLAGLPTTNANAINSRIILHN